jgi:very-short-patch-repair endonuclease
MGNELHKGASPQNFFFGRENRKQPTKTEQILWSHLRDRKLHGFKFRRQHPIGDFIADFYCHECKMIVEVDGEYHNDIEQKQYDGGRTYELNELKVKVIRFSNREVLQDIDLVLKEIGSQLLEIFRKIQVEEGESDDEL